MIKIYNANNEFPTNGILIDRSSILGNPFSHIPNKGKFPVDTREDAIRAYEDWIKEKLENKIDPYYTEFNRLISIFRDTGELHLICWCKPLPCHGDVLKKLINEK